MQDFQGQSAMQQAVVASARDPHLRDGGRTRPTRSATHAEAQEHTGTTAPRNETAIEAQFAPTRAR